jgi:membrane protein implicated in regulation of membrane protease activity
VLNHVLAVLGLAVYAFEVYRTVQRFGARRPGLLGAAAGAPGMHIFMAVLMAAIFVILAMSFAAVPLYVGPVGAVINGVYLVAALRYARRRSEERKSKTEERGPARSTP